MKIIFKNIFPLVLLFVWTKVYSQGTCATAVNLGTPSNTQACFNLSNGTTGSAPCAGAGYGGNSGGVTYVRFCTNASNTCINFSILQGTAGGNWAVTIYNTACSAVVDAQCLGNSGSGSTFNTSSPSNTPALAPNTCYTARIWSANPGTFTLCTQTLPVPNDFCSGASPLGPTSQFFNNYCMTAGTAGDPPPSQFCAGSLENNAWYTFTTSPSCVSPCTVTINISNIICSGGGNGFQIGFWTGSCSTLNPLGCVSGAGGSLNVSITGLSPGQVIIMGIDGNAGANCSYSISASNTVPVPIELLSFDASTSANKVFLKWITATEKNNKYFVVERSKDATNFYEVARVNGAINSNQIINYSVIDESPFGGISYYRIKQVNTNGTFEYSDLRTVILTANEKDNDFALVPNPAINEVAVIFNCQTNSNEVVSIYNNQGKVVMSKIINCREGINDTKIDISILPKGLYFVTLKTSSNNFRSKLIIQ